MFGRAAMEMERNGGALALRAESAAPMLETVARRIVQFAACLFVLLVAFTPTLECFDKWDRPTTPMTDTELRVTAWLAIAGTVAAVIKVLRSIAHLQVDRKGSLLRIPVVRVPAWCAPCDAVPTISPPCIPLRI
jgi:hypothetical protein